MRNRRHLWEPKRTSGLKRGVPRSCLVLKQFQDLGRGCRLAQSRKNSLDAVFMCVGVEVSHRIDSEHDLVAVIEGGTGGRLYADARGDTREYDLGDAEVVKEAVELRALKRSPTHFGDEIVAGLGVQFGDQISRVPGWGDDRFAGPSSLGATVGLASDVDEDDGQAVAAKGSSQTGGSAHNFVEGMHRRVRG